MKKMAVGVDIGGGSVKLGLVLRSGKIIARDVFQTEPKAGVQTLVSALTASIKRLLLYAKKQGEEVIGVGIGAPGPICHKTGLVYSLTNIRGWKSVYLGRRLRKRLKLPVFIDNDANVMALGEFYYGAGVGTKNLITLTLGTGIGGGLIIDGRLFRGPFFSAAEVGHMIINEKGPLCACGTRGCIEAYVGSGYFTRLVKKRLKREKSLLKKWIHEKGVFITPRLVAEAARQGDAFSKQIWKETGEHLGTVLAGLVNLLNPEKIILGGGIAQSGDLLFGPVRDTIKKKAFLIASSSVKVVSAQLGVDAGIVGSAALVFSLGES